MDAIAGTDLLEVCDWPDGRQHGLHRVKLGVGEGADPRQAIPRLLREGVGFSEWFGEMAVLRHAVARLLREGVGCMLG